MFAPRLKIAAITLAIALGGIGASTLTGKASALEGWQVANVAWGDTLNVRKYPASYSAKQSAYPNGTVLSLTGRCTDGLNLSDLGLADDKASAVRFRWCEVWHDPAQNGNFVTGWVYGKYIRPL